MSNKQIAENIRQEIVRLTEQLRQVESTPESVKIHYSLDKKYYYVTVRWRKGAIRDILGLVDLAGKTR